MRAESNVAVIGLGDVATARHLPVLAKHPLFQVTAAADVDFGRARTVARRFSISNVSADPLAVIGFPETDLVAILTPPFTHAALAHAALDAGKHVFVEKPLALDVEQAAALTAHAERAATTLLVGFNLRHHPLALTAREMIRAGRLGTIRTAASFLGNTYARPSGDMWRRDPARGGDAFFEIAVHHFDLLRFLLDANVTELAASESCAPNGAATVTTQLRFTNSTLATATIAEDTVEHNALELVGDKGKLNLNLYRFDGLQFVPRGAFEGSPGLRVSNAGKTVAALARTLPRLAQGGEYVLTYRAEWDHLAAVIHDKAVPLATARDGLEATRIAHAARQSVLEHAPITL